MNQRVYVTALQFDNTNKDGAALDRSRSTDYGWRADAVFAAAGASIEFGADLQRSRARHDVARALNDTAVLSPIDAFDAAATLGSVYAQAALRPASRLTVTPGLRLDWWRTSERVATSPWLTAELVATASTRLRVGGGVYRQFPDLEQSYGVRGAGSSLDAERATHVDVSLTQSLPFAATVTVPWYDRNEREVLWTPGAEPRRSPDGSVEPGRADAVWVNDLEGRARGFEVALARHAPTGLSGWAAYAHNAHRYTSGTTGESFASDAEQRHAVSLFGHYPLSNRTTVGLKFRYGSNYPRVGYFAEASPAPGAPTLFGGDRPLLVVLGGQRNALRLPPYARLDARIDHTFVWGRRRLTLFGEVANLLNRQNVRNVSYDVSRTGLVLGGTDAMLPILPSAGFVIEF
jgi:hypothetical protein